MHRSASARAQRIVLGAVLPHRPHDRRQLARQRHDRDALAAFVCDRARPDDHRFVRPRPPQRPRRLDQERLQVERSGFDRARPYDLAARRSLAGDQRQVAGEPLGVGKARGVVDVCRKRQRDLRTDAGDLHQLGTRRVVVDERRNHLVERRNLTAQVLEGDEQPLDGDGQSFGLVQRDTAHRIAERDGIRLASKRNQSPSQPALDGERERPSRSDEDRPGRENLASTARELAAKMHRRQLLVAYRGERQNVCIAIVGLDTAGADAERPDERARHNDRLMPGRQGRAGDRRTLRARFHDDAAWLSALEPARKRSRLDPGAQRDLRLGHHDDVGVLCAQIDANMLHGRSPLSLRH